MHVLRPPLSVTVLAVAWLPAFREACATCRALCAGLVRKTDLALRMLLVLGLLSAGVAPRAWDAERMLTAAKLRGPQAVAGVKALQMALSMAAELGDDAKLMSVNRFFNQRILFRDDTEVWGQVDYWASPLETLDKGQGDCEDFAIAKYFSLLAIGVPMPRLRLVYVRAQLADTVQAHMVLAYYSAPTAEPVILDNLVPDVLPASRRPDLSPVFSFNSEGLWQGVGSQAAGDPSSRLSRWRDVLGKARAEGFQ
jgi:predicted transglutaminase-like cysteine proteinase